MEIAPDQAEALRIAAEMIDAGIPIFAAPPCQGKDCSRKGHQDGKFQYDLPSKWQLTVPSHAWLERWRPGWALGAVGGHVADFLDEDPRNGGTVSIDELKTAGHMPRVFGVQETPSGGYHYVIAPLHERETNGFMPGLDYQGGMPDGKGRAFIWIAPTVKRSKVAPYSENAYTWLQPPDLNYLQEFESDDSGQSLRDRILAKKVRREGNEPNRENVARREFTESQAQRFCSITLDRLQQAEPGGIEDAANAAACQLSHFVPEFWSEEFAYAVLCAALGETMYDPNHEASTWTADKFHDVLAGVNGRAPGDWEAIRKPETVQEVLPEADAVDALLAEMLKPSEVVKRPPPRPLVRGLLNLDSESWIIGAPGSKKSFVALDIAGHVAAGMPWQGMKVHQARVVMVIAEGAGSLGPRLMAWQAEHGRPLADEEIFILPRPVQAADLEKWAVLIEACRRIGPGLVVLDTQARVTVGLEENSAKEMGVFIEAVRAIREATGACLLTVHHTGRAGGDARGSSAIDGAQYSELKVAAEKGSLSGKLISEKQKDMPLAPDVPLAFRVHAVGLDEDDEPITSLALRDATKVNAFEDAAGREVPPEVQAAPPAEISKWVERMLTIIVKDGPVGEGLTRADVFRAIDDHYTDKPATAAREWRVTKEAWKVLSDDPRVVKIGAKRDVEDLETRSRIESDLGRNSWGQDLGSNDR